MSKPATTARASLPKKWAGLTVLAAAAAVLSGCAAGDVKGMSRPKVLETRTLLRNSWQPGGRQIDYSRVSTNPRSREFAYVRTKSLASVMILNNSVFLNTQKKPLLDLGRQELHDETLLVLPHKERTVAYVAGGRAGVDDRLICQTKSSRRVVYRTRSDDRTDVGIHDFAWNPANSRYAALLVWRRPKGVSEEATSTVVLLDTLTHRSKTILRMMGRFEKGQDNYLWDVEYCSDGKRLFLTLEHPESPADEVLELDPVTGSERVVARHPHMEFTAASPDGRWLAVSIDRRLSLVYLKTRKRYSYPIDSGGGLAWLDNRTLLIGGYSGIQEVRFGF